MGLHETGYLTIDNCFHHFGYDRQQRHRSVGLRQVLGFLLVNGCDSSCLPGCRHNHAVEAKGEQFGEWLT